MKTPHEERRFRNNHRSCQLSWKDESINRLPRTRQVFSLIDGDDHLSYQLPPTGSTAGRILQHAAGIFERLLSKHKPMTFKFGITHDAHARWHSKKYGYRYSLEKFEHLTVVYAADNPYGPSFLEAALIDRFKSFFAELSSLAFYAFKTCQWILQKKVFRKIC